MKKSVLIIITTILSLNLVLSQEFKIHNNGLIYSDTTMEKLKTIVEDLNLKFKNCEINKTYYSLSHSIAYVITIKGKKVKEAQNDIDNSISYDDFVTKYKNDLKQRKDIILRYKDVNYQDEEYVGFTSTLGRTELSFSNRVDLFTKKLKNKWLYNYYEETDYRDEFISIMYFIDDFKKKKIADKYADLINYSDCMIDTNSNLFKKNPYPSRSYYEADSNSKVFLIMQHLRNQVMDEIDKRNVSDELDKEEKSKLFESVLDSLYHNKLKTNRSFVMKVNLAIEEGLNDSTSNDSFEKFVMNYISKDKALELKRSRYVIGYCSMDNSPRYHLKDIALLSAQTAKWEVFLRAHLNVMNDYVARNSDNSMAWADRKTYLKELEVLDINVIDLMLGISLRIENESNNHYYGRISRIGRALADLSEKDKFEEKIFGAIEDSQLDNLNRIYLSYLLLNYHYHLEDESRKTDIADRFEKALDSFPDFIAQSLRSELE